MILPGTIVSHLEIAQEEGVQLQRGMNFRLHGGFSVILMSLRPGAPYADRVDDSGRVLIYEGHDTPRTMFDHIIPYSKGGSSIVPENIQLLCARHNLAKRDRIE